MNKNVLSSLISVLIIIVCSGCQNAPVNQSAVAIDEPIQSMVDDNPFEGSWELNYVKAVFPDGREEVRDQKGMELKLFTPTHFMYVQRDSNGEFAGSGAGPYKYDRDSFSLTHAFQSVSEWAGYLATWDVKIAEDSFVMTNLRVANTQGEDITKDIIEQIGQPEQRYTRVIETGEVNPLRGAWRLVYRKAVYPDGKEEIRDEPRGMQLKLFTSDHFAYHMRDSDRVFVNAGGGGYVYEDGSFSETHSFQSVPEWVDYTATWSVRFEGDKYYFMTGPVKVVNSGGNDVTAEVIDVIGKVEETYQRAN